MTKTNNSEFALLSLLSKKSMSGYDIKQIVAKVAAFHWSESNSQIYPILEKLEKQNYVSSSIDEKSGERQRRIYSITNSGREHLKNWISSPVQLTQYREEFLLKLSAAEFIDTNIITSHFENYKDECIKQLQQIEKIQKNLQVRHSGKRLLYLQMVYDFSKLSLNAKVEWCEKNIKILKAY